MRSCFVWLLVCLPAVLHAQSSAQPDIAEILKRLEAVEHRVQELEQQNADLKRELASADTSSSTAASAPVQPKPSPATTATVASAEHGMPGMPGMAQVPGVEQETYPNLHFRGFADVDFQSTDAGVPSGFSLGQFVLHMTSPLSKKVSVFSELSFTARPNQYNTEVERVMVRYDANDYFKISFGKYHTPINYWNTAYHHGGWLQTTITRPEMIQFGGRFLPVHFVGLLAEGALPSGGLGLNYDFGVGNGRQTILNLGRDGDFSDVNSNRAIVANLYARPAKLYGLQVGGSFYSDEITPDPGTPSVAVGPYRERISSAQIVWNKETPEFIAEFANVHHQNIASGQEWNSQGMYAQIAYRLPGNARAFKPYYRFEYIHVPATEPVLFVPNLLGHTAGVRYDITDYAAFKMEYRYAKRTPTLSTNGVFLQTAFTF
jgi:hypothetical protein